MTRTIGYIKSLWCAVRSAGRHSPVALDPEHDLVAFLDAQRVTHDLRHGDLTLGAG
jgi:hypothetical protein